MTYKLEITTRQYVKKHCSLITNHILLEGQRETTDYHTLAHLSSSKEDYLFTKPKLERRCVRICSIGGFSGVLNISHDLQEFKANRMVIGGLLAET